MNEEKRMIVKAKDFNEFIDGARNLVGDLFTSSVDLDGNYITYDIDLVSMYFESDGELDLILSYKECLLIAQDFLKKQKHKKTEEIRYVVSESIYRNMIDIFHNRLVSNLLNFLANKGLIEIGYDSKSDHFDFWLKNNDKQQKQKPETD